MYALTFWRIIQNLFVFRIMTFKALTTLCQSNAALWFITMEVLIIKCIKIMVRLYGSHKKLKLRSCYFPNSPWCPCCYYNHIGKKIIVKKSNIYPHLKVASAATILCQVKEDPFLGTTCNKSEFGKYLAFRILAQI